MGEYSFVNVYYNWICSVAISDPQVRKDYSTLLVNLWNTNFVYDIPTDSNREVDGLHLRQTYCSMCRVPSYAESLMEQELYGKPCSVLEMMVALAIRIEDQIMKDTSEEDRTSHWFMEMVETLRLHPMTNDRFDFLYFERCMSIFFTRSYLPNGYGGLFKVENPRCDMRETEIWYQCMWHLEEVLQKETY